MNGEYFLYGSAAAACIFFSDIHFLNILFIQSFACTYGDQLLLLCMCVCVCGKCVSVLCWGVVFSLNDFGTKFDCARSQFSTCLCVWENLSEPMLRRGNRDFPQLPANIGEVFPPSRQQPVDSQCTLLACARPIFRFSMNFTVHMNGCTCKVVLLAALD